MLPRISALPLVLLFVAGCASTVPGGPKSPDTAQPGNLYAAALKAVSVPGPGDIGPGLLRIVPGNSDLVWRDTPSGRQVLVVSAMTTSDYNQYYKGQNTGANDYWGEIWVTAAPQLQRFCTAAPGDAAAKTARVVQWLGLNPAIAYAQVVEMWVAPDTLARPCPLTDITAATCTLDTQKASGTMPATASRPVCVAGDAACLERQSYWDWFSQNMRLNLQEGGAPWTRLGYTFDWKPKKGGGYERYGASEFVMKPGATYEVKAAYTLADYCVVPK